MCSEMCNTYKKNGAFLCKDVLSVWLSPEQTEATRNSWKAVENAEVLFHIWKKNHSIPALDLKTYDSQKINQYKYV